MNDSYTNVQCHNVINGYKPLVIHQAQCPNYFYKVFCYDCFVFIFYHRILWSYITKESWNLPDWLYDWLSWIATCLYLVVILNSYFFKYFYFYSRKYIWFNTCLVMFYYIVYLKSYCCLICNKPFFVEHFHCVVFYSNIPFNVVDIFHFLYITV